MSDLLYRIQSRLGDDAAVLWDVVAGTLDFDRAEWGPPNGNKDAEVVLVIDSLGWGSVRVFGRVVAAWCPRARLWATRVGFTDQYGPFFETMDNGGTTWLDRVIILDNAVPATEAA